ncbi:MAG: aminotransferase class IV [Sphaerochaetaceae bacterium]
MIGEHVIKNGRLISQSEAVVPVTLREVQYCFCTYESLRVLHSQIVHLDDHLLRLKNSCEGIHLTHSFSYEEIGSWTQDLIKADGIEDATLKILLYGGPSPMCFILASKLLTYPVSYYQDGIKVITYQGERLLPSCKTGNLLLNYMAVEEAKRQDGFEALLVNREDEVLEGTRSNFYAFKGGSLFTAKDEQVLLGVTRTRVLKAAEQLDIPIVFEAPLAQEVIQGYYDELFISATSMAAMPIAQVNDKRMGKEFSRTLRICDLVRKWEFSE